MTTPLKSQRFRLRRTGERPAPDVGQDMQSPRKGFWRPRRPACGHGQRAKTGTTCHIGPEALPDPDDRTFDLT
jgi:hypothetical protein